MEEADFGGRQRVITDENDSFVARIHKEFKDRATHQKWSLERRRTAAVQRQESLLVMNALLKLQLKGKAETISPNNLTHLCAHVEAMKSTDVAQLEGSFRSDPVFLGQEGFFELIRQQAMIDSFGRSASEAAISEIRERKGYNFKDDYERIFKLKEIDEVVLGVFIDLAKKTAEEIQGHWIASDRLNWFSQNLLELRTAALEIQTKLRNTIDFRTITYQELLKKEGLVNEARLQFADQLNLFLKKSLRMLITLESKKIREKVEKYLTQLNPLYKVIEACCRPNGNPSADLPSIQKDLRNTQMKLAQQIANMGELDSKLLKGTPLSPSILKTVELFQKQRITGFQREMDRLTDMYRMQSKGYREVKRYYFPNRP